MKMITEAGQRELQERAGDRRRFIQPRHHDGKSPKQRFDCGEESYQGTGKLSGQVAMITGADSGIGRAVAIAFAREGADVVIASKDEHEAAEESRRWVEKAGRRCETFAGDLCDPMFCRRIVDETVKRFGRLDILVNNVVPQDLVEDPAEIDSEEVQRKLMSNLFSYFHCTTAALREMKRTAVIINTSSAIAYSGRGQVISYASTKGVITAFTRSMAVALQSRGIRVNGVDPGPVLTPPVGAALPAAGLTRAGGPLPMHRRTQPVEMAPAYVHLASTDAAFMIGRVLHLDRGMIVA